MAAEAKKRRGTRTDLAEKFPAGDFGEAREKAAEMVGANPHYVTEAKKIEQDAPIKYSCACR